MKHTITFAEKELVTIAHYLKMQKVDYTETATRMDEGQLKQHYLDEANSITEVLDKINEVLGTSF
jgi:hypothetical protein